MPRKPRIHYPGAVYHVMLRGNGGQDIFFDPADRTRFQNVVTPCDPSADRKRHLAGNDLGCGA